MNLIFFHCDVCLLDHLPTNVGVSFILSTPSLLVRQHVHHHFDVNSPSHLFDVNLSLSLSLVVQGLSLQQRVTFDQRVQTGRCLWYPVIASSAAWNSACSSTTQLRWFLKNPAPVSHLIKRTNALRELFLVRQHDQANSRQSITCCFAANPFLRKRLASPSRRGPASPAVR